MCSALIEIIASIASMTELIPLTSLESTARMPAALASSDNSGVANSANIKIAHSGTRTRSVRAASSPFIAGIALSSKRTSGLVRAAKSIASCPFSASPHTIQIFVHSEAHAKRRSHRCTVIDYQYSRHRPALPVYLRLSALNENVSVADAVPKGSAYSAFGRGGLSDEPCCLPD